MENGPLDDNLFPLQAGGSPRPLLFQGVHVSIYIYLPYICLYYVVCIARLLQNNQNLHVL